MRTYSVLMIFFCAALLSACATLPEYSDPPITTADVVSNIKCELRKVVRPMPQELRWLQDWNSKFSLALKVFHNGGGDADGSLVVPLHPGTFTLGVTAAASGQATRTEEIEFSQSIMGLMDLSDIEAAKRDDERIRRDKILKKYNPPRTDWPLFPCPDDSEESHDRYALLGGRLGISDLIARTQYSKVNSDISPTSLIYTIEFIIERNASISPRFSLIPVGLDRVFGGGIKLGGSTKDTHTLKITLTPPASCAVDKFSGVCPQLVYSVPTPPAIPGAPLIVPGGGKALPRGGVGPADQKALDDAESRSILRNIIPAE